MTAHILLVDDELHVSQILGRRLEREGYRVTIARDGLEATQLAAQEIPDLVISDLQMPRMDGLGLATALAAAPALAGVPIILLTARGHRIDQQVVDRTAITRVLAKPFSAHEVTAVAAQVLAETQREAA
jgi:CheY-like chemotaxis protein